MQYAHNWSNLYIGGDGYSAPIITKSDGTAQNYLYLHRDNQGSIIGISNQAKQILERRIFDAWGTLIKLQNSAGQYVINNGQILMSNYSMLLDRGYTGHEHLLGIGLINMNGRLYDPKLKRFLMPDNNLQDPSNSQNYNRYGYVLNNPIMFTDPTGEDGTGPCDGCSNWHINNNGSFGYNSPYFQANINPGYGDSLRNLVNDWDKAGMKDWFHQNFNFNNWSNGVKSVGNWGSNSYKSVDHWASNIVKSVNIEDIGDWFSNNFKSIFGINKNNTPAIKYAPANAYSFGSNGSNSEFVSSQSTSPSMGYNNGVEMHPFAEVGQTDMVIMNTIRNNPALNRQYNRILSQNSGYYLKFVDVLSANNGLTIINPKNESNPKTLYTNIYRVSTKDLPYTIMHEFGHAWSAISGFRSGNYNIYGINSGFPGWIDEIYADRYAQYWGGFPLSSDSYINNSNNLNTSIHPLNTIKFPKSY